MKVKRFLICESNGTIIDSSLIKDEELTERLKGYYLAGRNLEELRIITIEVTGVFVPTVEHNFNLIKNSDDFNEMFIEPDNEMEEEEEEVPTIEEILGGDGSKEIEEEHIKPPVRRPLKRINKCEGRVGHAFPD